MTAAGKVPPAKVLVLGGGVAGLAAVQTAKNMGAIVYLFDVRDAVAEQAQSMGATFLRVDYEESGEGGGGCAKEMSKEWHEAANKMLAEQCKDMDIVITTALIPGKPAPKLVHQNMMDNLKAGSVVVDLAASQGGNCVATEKDQAIVTDNGVTVIGYTDINSRLASTSSSLYANNQMKWILSAGPTTTKVKGEFALDPEDIAVRGMTIINKGELQWPWTPPAPPPPPPKKETAEDAKKELTEDDYKALYVTGAKQAAYGAAGFLALGCLSPAPAFSTMFSTFALSGVIGYQVVWGVVPALHSPLMAVTNAISGMTAVGGMYAMGGGIVPSTTAELLAATATGISAVNITGGFLVTKKMLDLFKRPTDPPEFYEYYGVPAAGFVAGYALTNMAGFKEASSIAASASALLCIGGIAGLSTQATARMGNVSGMAGVSFESLRPLARSTGRRPRTSSSPACSAAVARSATASRRRSTRRRCRRPSRPSTRSWASPQPSPQSPTISAMARLTPSSSTACVLAPSPSPPSSAASLRPARSSPSANSTRTSPPPPSRSPTET